MIREFCVYDEDGTFTESNEWDFEYNKDGSFPGPMREIIRSHLTRGHSILIRRPRLNYGLYSHVKVAKLEQDLKDAQAQIQKRGGERMGYFSDIVKGLRIVGVLTSDIPLIMFDGKVTIEELVGLAEDICEVGGWKTEFSVPEELKSVEIGVKEK